MPTTLTFDIESCSGKAPLFCGVDNYVTVKLKTACIAKSHDGSGYLIAPITAVARVGGTMLWRYTVVVPDTQLSTGSTLTQNDVTGSIGCISQTDDCLFQKLLGLTIDPSWEMVSATVPSSSGEAVASYMFRRATSWVLQAFEIGAANPQNTITVQLQVSGLNNNTYTNLGLATTITPPAFSARRVLSSPVTVPAGCAVRAVVTSGNAIYSPQSMVDIHLFTTTP